MEGFLRVNTATTTLPGSPTNSFLADEVASICPLLTPSPPTNDLINPLPEPEQPTFTIGEELANKLQHVKNGNEKEGSTSSSSSTLAEPACTQLLNHRHTYHHITKDENASIQETIGKVQPLQLTFKNSRDDYFFMSWNWPLIRKVSLWTFLSGLLAMVALVIAMVISLPKTCNPPTQWYQGSVFYEIFPASFSDSNNDGIGDLNGISSKVDYLRKLGIRAVRLNSIFKARNYPENYKDVTTLLEIAPELGKEKDLKKLTDELHSKNISIVLDIPVWPLVKTLKPNIAIFEEHNETDNNNPSIEFLRSSNLVKNDEVSEAIVLWLQYRIDGFYLKGLENYAANDPHLAASLRRWKSLLGQDRPIIVSYKFLEKVPKSIMNTVLSNIDLVDVELRVENGVEEFSKQIGSLLNGTLFSAAHMPWIHWNVGDEDSKRLANRLTNTNTTLGVFLLQMMLPGTASIFYGDEIALKQVADPHEERKDVVHLHQLGGMVWEHPVKQRKGVLPWMHGHPTESNFDQLELISKMVDLRRNSPSIYVNSVRKDGINKANAEVKYTQNDIVIVQRWYPRRKNFVVITNLGINRIIGDLSNSLYSGEVVVGPRINFEIASFKSVSLCPGESVVVLLH